MLGPNGTINQILVDAGYTDGTLNDKWYAFLTDQGYTGTLNDMAVAYFAATYGTGSYATDLEQWRLAEYALSPGVLEVTHAGSGGSDAGRLSRSIGTFDSLQQFTISSWMYSQSATPRTFGFSAYTNTSNYFSAHLLNSGEFVIRGFDGGGETCNKRVTTGSNVIPADEWTHMCIVVDTTDAVAEDRIKLYINGTRWTTWNTNTNPSVNDSLLNNSLTMYVGGVTYSENSSFSIGYNTEMCFVDGAVLSPSDFGVDDDGTWSPIEPNVDDWGSEGHYYRMLSGVETADSSGNGHTLTNTSYDFTSSVSVPTGTP